MIFSNINFIGSVNFSRGFYLRTINSNMSFGANYGLIVNYEFKSKHGLTMELFANSRASQKFGYYENGHYLTECSEVNYYKASLMYYTDKILYGKKRNHRLVLRSGMYFALNKASSIKTDETLTSFNTNFSKFDYGLRATISEEIEFHKFIFGYGIQSETGLNNIRVIPESTSLSEGVTTNFNIGLFLNIRYKL